MECQLLMASCVRMAHYTPTILTSEWSQYPDNQNTTTISTSVTFWHHSLRLTGSSSTSLRHKSNRKKTHNGQTFWADIKYQRVKYLVLSWNVSKTWQLDAGIVGAQRTLSVAHMRRAGAVIILVITFHRHWVFYWAPSLKSAAWWPLNQSRLSPSHFHAQLCPILLWPILSRLESFEGKRDFRELEGDNQSHATD